MTSQFSLRNTWIKHSITRISLLLVFIAAGNKEINAQKFHLVKDINTSTDASPNNYNSATYNYYKQNVYAVLNGISYYAAEDGVNGAGLWRSDGTEAGTYELKNSVNPTDIVAANGKIFFSASGNNGLWVSDGTAAGTTPVLSEIPSGVSGFKPSGLTNLNGIVYFAVDGHSIKDQLWKTDGTEQGTTLVKDFYTGVYSTSATNVYNITAIKNKLYFNAYSNNDTYAKLWVSNGTLAGTHIISTTLVQPAQLVERSANASDSSVYFTAFTGPNGFRTLFITNGDSGKAVIPGGFNGRVSIDFISKDIIVNQGVIYFIGSPNVISPFGQSLYKFDVNAASGIQPVKTVSGTNTVGGSSSVNYLNILNGTLYFTIYDAVGNKYQLWKSNGTSLGNVLLKDSLLINNMISANGQMYFSANDFLHGFELWKTDGTINGTVMIKDINAGMGSANPGSLTSVNNKLLFSANDGIHGNELWQSDGTATSNILVKDMNQTSTSSSTPDNVTAFKNGVLFTAYEGKGDDYAKIFKSGGDVGSTTIINDTIYSQGNSQKFYVVNGTESYFWGNSLAGREGLYKTDGTAAGTVLVKDFRGIFFRLYYMKAANSLLYFYGYNGLTRRDELWRTDGTTANTFLIKNDFTSLVNNNQMGVINDNLLFIDQSNGSYLWKTDGTVYGTVLLKIFPGYAHNFTKNNGILYLSAFDGTRQGLWKSDGTIAGTALVSINTGNPSNFISSHGDLFFTATDLTGYYGNVGTELFKTDGTSGGTVLVKDILPGMESSEMSNFADVNGKLFFFVNNSPDGSVDLWTTDGTAIGSEIIKSAVTTSVLPPDFQVGSNGKLFFIINDALWESDGTQVGTHIIEDTILKGLTFEKNFPNVTSVNNQLFFSAYSYKYGLELYAETMNETLPVKLLSFKGTLDKEDGLLKWSTANEQNNSYFNLQRSTSGTDFKTVAKIEGAGVANFATNYSYTDKNIVRLGSKKIYYRLQQADQDGTILLSNIAVINIKNQSQFSVAPNPVKNTINIYSTSNVDKAKISVTDMSGKLLYTKQQNIRAGQKVQVESSTFAKGVYIIAIENAGAISQIKVVKK